MRKLLNHCRPRFFSEKQNKKNQNPRNAVRSASSRYNDLDPPVAADGHALVDAVSVRCDDVVQFVRHPPGPRDVRTAATSFKDVKTGYQLKIV